MRADNTHHLRRAVAQRHDTTHQKAAAALVALHADGHPITVTSLAHARIRELTAEVKRLREQLAKTYGQLRSPGR